MAIIKKIFIYLHEWAEEINEYRRKYQIYRMY